MAKLIQGERAGKRGTLSTGASAIIFDAAREKVLLTRRTDNGRWCLPGGRMEPGESAAETCARETWEETGLRVRVGRLVGIYTSPDYLIEYADGNRRQIVAMSFEAEVIGGELGTSDETTEFGYFSPAEMREMDVMEHHVERIRDAFAGQEAAFVR
jgi:8-oxo-dGTP pyrophosphatase MutT (NUDIX family)